MSYYTNVWASEIPDIVPMLEVSKLRSDAQVTVSELTSSVNDSFLLKEDFNKYNQEFQKKLYTFYRNNKNIINQLSNLTKICNEKLDIKVGTNDETSSSQNVLQNQDDNASISTRRYADNDVIIKNSYSNNLQQVPEFGFFSGNTNDTDLFWQL